MTVSAHAVPSWLRRLASQITDLDPRRLSRLLPPDDGSGRPSAVLVAFTRWRAADCVVLLRRSDRLRAHPGQVAFPGGASEPGDGDPVATALREAHEEAGIEAADVDVVCSLPTLWIPVSDFVVTPVVGWWRRPDRLRADGSEMLHAALVPLTELAEPANRFTVVAASGWRGPGFEVAGMFVWGFTAGLLDRLLAFGGWERPWRPDARVLPAPVPPVRSAEELVAE